MGKPKRAMQRSKCITVAGLLGGTDIRNVKGIVPVYNKSPQTIAGLRALH